MGGLLMRSWGLLGDDRTGGMAKRCLGISNGTGPLAPMCVILGGTPFYYSSPANLDHMQKHAESGFIADALLHQCIVESPTWLCAGVVLCPSNPMRETVKWLICQPNDLIPTRTYLTITEISR